MLKFILGLVGMRQSFNLVDVHTKRNLSVYQTFTCKIALNNKTQLVTKVRAHHTRCGALRGAARERNAKHRNGCESTFAPF